MSYQYHQIANLLEKMTSSDKDFRFMATNDLMTELQKDSIKLDDESEKKVVRMVLKLLEDKNGEVQNLAVKCLGPLVIKVKESQVETIVDTLCLNMISNVEQLRDISSIGLKTVILELPQAPNSLAPNVCRRITGKLNSAIEKILDICLKYLSYDPNYNYESDDGQSCLAMDTEEGDYADSDDYSDDDDISWKVRRAAAKCLEALIITRQESLESFCQDLGPILILRFKEREENVKSDIFHVYTTLLKSTKFPNTLSQDPDSMEEIPRSIALLQDQVQDIIKTIQPLMRERSMKTRQDCFFLLRELLSVLPGSLGPYLDDIVPGINYSLNDKNSTSNIKINALGLLGSLLASNTPSYFFQPHFPVLVPLIVNAVFDSFYKISTEALQVLQELVKVLRPMQDPAVPLPTTFEISPFVEDLYSATLKKLMTSDVDQEVKDRAISCMGQIIANLGDFLVPQVKTCLPILMERLNNEVTRLSSVKAIYMIAASPLRIDLTLITKEVIPILGSFLRKNHRALKLHSLDLLNKLIQNYSHTFHPQILQSVIIELKPLISDSDLHIAQYCLTTLTTTALKQPKALEGIHEQFLPAVFLLVRSPLLQGSALSCTLDLLQVLVQTNLPNLEYSSLLKKLMDPIIIENEQLHKQAHHSLAKCIAALTLKCPWEAIPLAVRLLDYVQKSNVSSDSKLSFCLLTIGEIGRNFDLSSIFALPQTLIECFGAGSEDVKSASSLALGAVAVGSLDSYLPLILKEIEGQPKRQYLLLHSLKEVISSLSVSQYGLSQLLPSVPTIWTQLFKHCESSEEGSRNVVAECLGKLVLVNPAELLPLLRDALYSDNAIMRAVVVSSIKYTISDQPQTIDHLLKQNLGEFLSSLRDPDPGVRRVALVTFNAAIHNKPTLVRDLLPSLLPLLYSETKIKCELIREVEMGPFKHTVDDGLDIRKAAFECMYTLLEQGLDRVDVKQFLGHVQAGLCDHYDIKMLTYLMTARLAVSCPDAVLQQLDQFIQQLRETCTYKVKANSVKQEHEKQDELKRSALRAVSALSQIPSADKNQHLTEFLKTIKDSPELCKIFDSIQKDSSPISPEITSMDQS
ncbi:cullin-associated NEDD8-dissociated protein 1 isoform X1 [Rhagoletis pomonella]|uniref:cullin-associated NEDD8-dissociated protein 1 isoform X1 n=1 Tax=Rhagoletis pomonella TaxID=28610 RepID=UPI00177C40B2|nr:cullin-associated NEDD8-dissociated protein 1 isoform X1 [Rhagoletis pomonella]